MSEVSEFSYSNSTFSKSSDNNPIPIISGTCSGVFSSTSGINIDDETGEIILNLSDVGTYVITYTVSDGVNVDTSSHNLTISS